MSVLVIPEFENEDDLLPETDETDIHFLPDERANAPVSEIAERFLRAVLAKVPLDRIEELHLFSPLRQGTAETGIAVIAARVIVDDEPIANELELQLESAPDVAVVGEDVPPVGEDVTPVGEDVTPVGEDIKPVGEDVVAVAEDVVSDEDVLLVGDDITSDAAIGDAEPEPLAVAQGDADADDSPYADDLPAGASEASLDDVLEFEHELAPDVADETPLEPPAPRIRHTVYTARYRLVIKGPERGRWEMDVVDEADAPLLTVETVVRGVQRRAGEETATVRYDAAQLARALRLNPPV